MVRNRPHARPIDARKPIRDIWRRLKKCRVQGLDGGRTWDPMIRVSCLYFLINGLDANYGGFWPNKINRLHALTNGSEPADLIKETRSAELREE
jgi:hypothetical protein